MKHTLFKNLIFLTFLSVFVVGCGKDGGGGSSSSNPLTGGNGLSGNSSTNYQKLSNWYKAGEPTSLRGYYKISRTINSQVSNGSSCPGEIKEILGFIKICVYSNTSGSTSTNGTTTRYLVGIPTGGNINKPDSCLTTNGSTCSEAVVHYPGKSANTKLQAALNSGSSLYLQAVTQLSSTVYQLSYSNSSLETTPRIIYKIDTSLHSMYNPVEIVDLSASTQEYIAF